MAEKQLPQSFREICFEATLASAMKNAKILLGARIANKPSANNEGLPFSKGLSLRDIMKTQFEWLGFELPQPVFKLPRLGC